MKTEEKIPFFCPPLDRLTKGGLPRGQIFTLYGEAGSGKTALAAHCAVNVARAGQTALYVDADAAFTADRLGHLLRDAEGGDVASRLWIFSPSNFFEQTLVIESLERFHTGELGMIVVDSVNRLYRLAATDLERAALCSRELGRQMAYLTHLAKTHNAAVLVTSHVRSLVDEPFARGRVEPVATRTVRRWSRGILQLRSTPKPGERIAFLEKIEGRRARRAFCYFNLEELRPSPP